MRGGSAPPSFTRTNSRRARSRGRRAGSRKSTTRATNCGGTGGDAARPSPSSRDTSRRSAVCRRSRNRFGPTRSASGPPRPRLPKLVRFRAHTPAPAARRRRGAAAGLFARGAVRLCGAAGCLGGAAPRGAGGAATAPTQQPARAATPDRLEPPPDRPSDCVVRAGHRSGLPTPTSRPSLTRSIFDDERTAEPHPAANRRRNPGGVGETPATLPKLAAAGDDRGPVATQPSRTASSGSRPSGRSASRSSSHPTRRRAEPAAHPADRGFDDLAPVPWVTRPADPAARRRCRAGRPSTLVTAALQACRSDCGGSAQAYNPAAAHRRSARASTSRQLSPECSQACSRSGPLAAIGGNPARRY